MPQDKKLEEEEEALVVSLFRSFAPASPRPQQTQSSSSSIPSFPVVSNPKSVEGQLLDAERQFLESKQVSTSNVPLQEVADRFRNSAMPQQFSPEREYVKGLVDTCVQDAVHTNSPVMIGHMTSSLPYYARPLSRLITTMNQNSVKTETANTVTFLERQALAELHRQLYANPNDNAFYEKYTQDPSCALGVLTSGGTISNITALWVARNRCLPRIDEVGFVTSFNLLDQKYSGIVCIGSELLHYSMTKALDILGLGWTALIKVPVDEHFCAPVAKIRAAAEKARNEGKLILCIIGLAGSTEAGSFDDLDGLADVAQEFNCHFHVDAAWGGPAIFSKTLSKRLKGVNRADTVTMDGHKQLYVPMGCGLLFFKDPELSKAVRKTAGYIIRTDSHDLGKFTLEGSRPANAVHLHSNLHILGVRGYELLVDRSARMTNYMADRVRESDDFELLVDPPQTNILLYRAIFNKKFKTVFSNEEDNKKLDELNVRLQETQKIRGKTFVSRTSIRSPHPRHSGCRIVALRVVIANPLTYEDDVDHVLADQREILQEILPGQPDQKKIKLEEVHHPVADEEVKAQPKNRSYWSEVWKGMDPQARALFHDSEEQFIGSLISPALDFQEGLFKEGSKYEKHLEGES